MSNADRIYEILKEYTGVSPDSGAARPILQAMEQYGSECATKATRLSFEATLPQIKRLKELVKAQKELIELILTCKIKKGMISMSIYQAKKREEIMERIKKLES